MKFSKETRFSEPVFAVVVEGEGQEEAATVVEAGNPSILGGPPQTIGAGL